MKEIKNKKIFWDYDLNSIDLKNKRIKTWFLSRKINFGDFSDITKNDLKRYLPKLDISPAMKELLRNYLKSNV